MLVVYIQDNLEQKVCPENVKELEDDQETIEDEVNREELKDPSYIIQSGVKYPGRI